MKSTILLAIFFVGMVFGTTMMFFGNPYGDYLVVTSVVIGLYTMALLEKEEKKDSESFF
jgi:hypothetical protein